MTPDKLAIEYLRALRTFERATVESEKRKGLAREAEQAMRVAYDAAEAARASLIAMVRETL